jgi:hypothetical protein
VADADAQRGVGADGHADDGVAQDRAAVDERGAAAVLGVGAAAADERHAGAGHGVGAADDLGLADRRAVGEQEQDLVVAAGDVAGARGGAGAGVAGVLGGRDGGHREGQAGAAEREDDDRAGPGAGGVDLAGRRAADDGDAGRDVADLGGERVQLVAAGGEDEQEPGVGARGQRRGRGLAAGDRGIGVRAASGARPAAGPLEPCRGALHAQVIGRTRWALSGRAPGRTRPGSTDPAAH